MVSFMHTYTTSQHMLKDAMHHELHIHNLNLEVCATFKHVTLSPGLVWYVGPLDFSRSHSLLREVDPSLGNFEDLQEKRDKSGTSGGWVLNFTLVYPHFYPAHSRWCMKWMWSVFTHTEYQKPVPPDLNLHFTFIFHFILTASKNREDHTRAQINYQ